VAGRGERVADDRRADEAGGDPVLRLLNQLETLVSIDRARERIGYSPTHIWRDEYRRD